MRAHQTTPRPLRVGRPSFTAWRNPDGTRTAPLERVWQAARRHAARQGETQLTGTVVSGLPL